MVCAAWCSAAELLSTALLCASWRDQRPDGTRRSQCVVFAIATDLSVWPFSSTGPWESCPLGGGSAAQSKSDTRTRERCCLGWSHHDKLGVAESQKRFGSSTGRPTVAHGSVEDSSLIQQRKKRVNRHAPTASPPAPTNALGSDVLRTLTPLNFARSGIWV